METCFNRQVLGNTITLSEIYSEMPSFVLRKSKPARPMIFPKFQNWRKTDSIRVKVGFSSFFKMTKNWLKNDNFNAPLRNAICIVFVIFESVFGHFEKTAKTYFWISFWLILKFWKNQFSSWFWLPQALPADGIQP